MNPNPALPIETRRGQVSTAELTAPVAVTAAAAIVIAALELSATTIQSLQAPISLLMLGYCIHLGRTMPEVRRRGWHWVLAGVNLIAFGSLMGAFGRVPWLKPAPPVLTPDVLAWLNTDLALPLGLTFLAFGAVRWLPDFVGHRDAVAGYLERTLGTMERQRSALEQAEARARAAEERALAEEAAHRRDASERAEAVRKAAHQLNNPLAVITGYIELLEDDPLPPETKEILGHVYDASFRCKEILAKLVDLSMQETSESDSLEFTPTAAGTLVGRRVLVVDNLPILTEFCREGLERAGCRVDVASSEAGALALLRNRKYDSLLVDLRTPGLQGGERFLSNLQLLDPKMFGRTVLIAAEVAPEVAASPGVKEQPRTLLAPFSVTELQDAVRGATGTRD
ncbi:MAG: response regulator [Candidatus Wallbacteria bacterium]|nr:response regulator [Candidatus Wallbacteria bacterium]